MRPKHATTELRELFSQIQQNYFARNLTPLTSQAIKQQHTRDSRYNPTTPSEYNRMNLWFRKHIDINQQTTLKMIGQGTFNVAYLFRYQEKDYVIKFPKPKRDGDEHSPCAVADNPHRVKEIHRLVNPKYFSDNVHVIPVCFPDSGAIDCLIMPFIDGDDLDSNQKATAQLDLFNKTNGCVIPDGFCCGNAMIDNKTGEVIYVDPAFMLAPKLQTGEITPHRQTSLSTLQMRYSGEVQDSQLFWDNMKQSYHIFFIDCLRVSKYKPAVFTTRALLALRELGIHTVNNGFFKQNRFNLHLIYESIIQLAKEINQHVDRTERNQANLQPSISVNFIDSQQNSNLVSVQVIETELRLEIQLHTNMNYITSQLKQALLNKCEFALNVITDRSQIINLIISRFIDYLTPIFTEILHTQIDEQTRARHTLANTLFKSNRYSYINHYVPQKIQAQQKTLSDTFDKFPSLDEFTTELNAKLTLSDHFYSLHMWLAKIDALADYVHQFPNEKSQQDDFDKRETAFLATLNTTRARFSERLPVYSIDSQLTLFGIHNRYEYAQSFPSVSECYHQPR